MSKQGVLTVVSGFSGAGKGTLMKTLLEQHNNYCLSTSATTRAPRVGEVEGREYFFLTKEQFESMIRKNQFIEWAEYVNHYYGTPREYVEQQLKEGKDVILEIEIQGAIKVKEQFPETLLIFIMPPSAAALQERLTKRGTEDMETIKKRLARAIEESDFIKRYDSIVINDTLQEAVDQMHNIITAWHSRIEFHQSRIELIKKELKQIEERR